MDDGEGEEEEDEQIVYVYPANAAIVRVFLACQITLQIGFGAAVYTGIPRTEISAVCDMLSIPQDERERVLIGVQQLVNAVLPEMNARD